MSEINIKKETASPAKDKGNKENITLSQGVILLDDEYDDRLCSSVDLNAIEATSKKRKLSNTSESEYTDKIVEKKKEEIN